MKTIKTLFLTGMLSLGLSAVSATPFNLGDKLNRDVPKDSLRHVLLEPWTYTENFETRDLGAWASYPHWQDIAYNQNFRVNEIVTGDPNISIVQKITPYTAVDNYGGAQKLIDAYIVPGSTIKFRYYLKAHQSAEWYKVRFAAGSYGKLDVTISNPKINAWTWITLDYDDFVKENPIIANNEKVKINALAFLVKFPSADPDMPIYLGLDDITFKTERAAEFRFTEPSMYKLPEFKPYIPKKHYYSGQTFTLNGKWAKEVEKVKLEIFPFTDDSKSVYREDLIFKDNSWAIKPIKLKFPEGLYKGKLKAYKRGSQVSETEFTIHIAPENIKGQHPRLLFDADNKKVLSSRLEEEAYLHIGEGILSDAAKYRKEIPVESLIYDLDQFPEEDWLPTWAAWGSRIYHTGEALRSNARAYAFHNDKDAGNYVKEVLVTLSRWPDWTHPWQTKRGRFSEHRTGNWSHRLAEAYDLVYDFMNEDERLGIRSAIMKNIVEGVHRTYIYDDNITGSTSNWLAMTVGGSLMNMAAIFDDGSDVENLEPYFTGAVMKLDKFINAVTDSKDGAWGEGFGYNMYSMSNLSYSLPSMENVFNIDMTKPLENTFNEYIWAGLIKNKKWFEYGDGGGNLQNSRNGAWAFLLNKYKSPRLSWFYNFTKSNDPQNNNLRLRNNTFEDLIFKTTDIPKEDPFKENPVKLFREIGTTVFKSGWEKDDFVFVMRTGPFYNHQHLDQGSFWLADRGEIFIEERPLANSDYYDDPIYESWLTQPVGHSTILLDDNNQSQRVGDHLTFAEGFNDHAYVSHFLDGENAAFSTGNIGRLYWDKVSELSRNILYLKPRTVLMLDVVVPQEKDTRVSLLYQTAKLRDLNVKRGGATIVKNEATLHVLNLSPQKADIKTQVTPHYLKTLRNVRPLEREGMLTISNHTNNLEPLVMANLLTTTSTGKEPDVSTQEGNGFISGEVAGKKFAFTTNLGQNYQFENFNTDALALTWNNESIFVSKAKCYSDEKIDLLSDKLITFELFSNTKIDYYLDESASLTIGIEKKPVSVLLNKQPIKGFRYDADQKNMIIDVPSGTGIISINYK